MPNSFSRLLLSLLLFTVVSCSNFLWNESSKSKVELQGQACSYLNKKIILGPSNDIARASEQFFKEQLINSESEQLLYLTLLHMRFFPHLVGPSSSLLFIDHDKFQQNVYRSTFSIENQYPLLSFLNHLAHKNNRPLSFYLKNLQENFVLTTKVTPSLHQFVSEHLKQIKKNDVLAAFYLRGNDPINIGESLPNLNLDFLNGLSAKAQMGAPKKIHLFSLENSNQLSCSFDSKIYENKIYPSLPSGLETLNFSLLGPLSRGLHLSIFQNRIEPLKMLGNTPFFEGVEPTIFPAVCLYQDGEQSQFALSLQGRDPAQHLYHLMSRGLFENNSQALKLLDSARFLYLNNPRRMLVESQLASANFLSELLSESLPLYHMEILGEVHFHDAKQSTFYIDARAQTEQRCK